jgi:hypothetical protein
MEALALFTWVSLATLPGASLAVFIIVQFTKELVARVFPKLPTDIYATIIAAIVLSMAGFFSGAMVQMTPFQITGLILLCLINGFIVALASGQLYNKVLNPPGAIKTNQIEAGE